MAGNDSYTTVYYRFQGAEGSTGASNVGAGSSASYNPLTFSGTAEINTGWYAFSEGGTAASLKCDGNSDYTTQDSTNSTDWEFGSGDFTIDLRAYWTVSPNGKSDDGLLFAGVSGEDDGWRFEWDDNANNLEFRFNVTEAPLTYNWIPSTTTEYHLAVERSSSTWTMFVDGSVVATGSNATAILAAVKTPLLIGMSYTYSSSPWRWNSTAKHYMNGYIDEVRISKGIARYKGQAFTPPSSPYTVDGEGSVFYFYQSVLVGG